MEVKTRLQPGGNGTRTLQQQYGRQLACVHRRYGTPRQGRYNTTYRPGHNVVVGRYAGMVSIPSRYEYGN